VSWGGGSAGGTDHILGGLIAKAVGADPSKLNYVAFKGGGDAIAAIVGGHVTAGISGLGEFAEQIKGGRMRALAVSSPERDRRHPDAEGTGHRRGARQLARHLRRAGHQQRAARRAGQGLVRAATDSPAWKETLNKLGWTPWFLGGDAYKAFIEEDTKRIAAIIESLGLKK
jgi:putative tricarboxylic transport membrane protein